MTAGELLWNTMKFNILTGTIGPVLLGISGLVMQRMTTFVSAVSITTALILEKCAIAILLLISCRMKVNQLNNLHNFIVKYSMYQAIGCTFKGYITDKNLLPITRLNFGRTSLPGSSGRFSLGAFECEGRRSETTSMPTNCKDLFLSGHTLNGFYSILVQPEDESVASTNQTRTIYCDFTRPVEEMSVVNVLPLNAFSVESLVEKIDQVQLTLSEDIEQRTNKVYNLNFAFIISSID